MTAKDHNKLLGIFFTVNAGLNLLAVLIGALMYGGIGLAMLGARAKDERFLGGIFLVAAVAMIPVGILILAPQVLAALKMLKNKNGARFWGIFAAILVLLSFPIGTALGVYALWFLLSDEGKAFYGAGKTEPNGFAPPPPNSWK